MNDLSPNRIDATGRKIGGAAPLKSDPVALGREAWARRKADVRTTWEDWKLIGKALLFGRNEAKKKANNRVGRKYNDLFGRWLEVNGFGDIDKSDRAKLLLIMENLDGVEEWRAKLTERERAQWNHPSSIWRTWTCKNRGNRGKPRSNKSASQLCDAECNEDVDHDEEDEDEDQAEIKWQRNILLRARKSIGHAKIRDRWMLPEPPEQGTIEAVRQAAEAWTRLAKFLDAEVQKAA